MRGKRPIGQNKVIQTMHTPAAMHRALASHKPYIAATVSVPIRMLMIRRYMVIAVHQLYWTYSSVCRHALMRCTAGCSPTDFSWIPTSRSWSGVPLLAGNFQDVHPGLGLMPSFGQRLCEILVFILILISACRHMSSGLSQVAL